MKLKHYLFSISVTLSGISIKQFFLTILYFMMIQTKHKIWMIAIQSMLASEVPETILRGSIIADAAKFEWRNIFEGFEMGLNVL